MAPSPELGQPKAPDKAGDEPQKEGPLASGDATDRSCGAGTSSACTVSEQGVAASAPTKSAINNSVGSSGSVRAGTSAAPIVVPPVISTMAMSAPTTSVTTTSATAMKVSSSSSSSSSTVATTSSGNSSHGKSTETAKNSSSSAIVAGNNKDSHQQSFAQEPFATMNEDALKALLDEAITYKCPKDREHKSATFNELLSKTEREDQEQNFSFTSRPVHSKRASARPTQGGSLQDITEATKQEYGYTEYCSGSSLSNKRHGGPGHGGGSRSKRQISSVSSRQREGGSLPSNVNETTTPSYINEQPFLKEVGRPLKSTSVKFFAKSNDYGALLQSAPLNAIGASDWSGLVSEESQSNATGGETGNTGTGVGSHSTSGTSSTGTGAAAHTVINMGELDSDEGSSGHRGFRDIFSGHANDALQRLCMFVSQNNHYDSSAEEIEMMGMGPSSGSGTGAAGSTSSSSGLVSGGSAGVSCGIGGSSGTSASSTLTYGGGVGVGTVTDTYGNGGGSSNSSSSSSSSSGVVGGSVSGGLSSTKKTFCYPKAQFTTQASLEIGQACSVTRPSSVHHVDKTVSLPMLETVQLGSTYPAVKCMIDSSKVDQSTIKSVLSSSNQFISTTRSSLAYPTIQQKFDENANSVSQFGGVGSGGGLGSSSGGSSMATGAGSGSGSGNKKSRKPKSDRNTVVVVPENIAGYRGKADIEALVSYIENTDNDKSQQPQHQLSQHQQLQLQQQQQQQQQQQTLHQSSSQQSTAKGGSLGAGSSNAVSGLGAKNGNVKQTPGVATSGNLCTTDNGGGGEEKAKRKNEKKRERAAKMKKSSSLEELSSSSRKKVEEENTRQNHVEKARAQETDPAVTLRNSKSKKSAQTTGSTSTTTTGSTCAVSASSLVSTKEGSSGKRSERRSWGTEELSFLGNDGSATSLSTNVEDVSSSAASAGTGGKGKKAKDHNAPVTTGTSSNSSNKNVAAVSDISSVTGNNHNIKKRDSLRMSVESLSALGGGSIGTGGESSDFHVVTKKKKTKKKTPALGQEESLASGNCIAGSTLAGRRYQGAGSVGGGSYGRNAANTATGNNSGGNGGGNGSGRYQTGSHFVTDRDVYMSSDLSRRKSTSSVPPSEKSDSSDTDSVHSLPIETNVSRKQQQKLQQQSHQQQQPKNKGHLQQTSQQRQGTSSATSQSYAEIARIANVEKSATGTGTNGSAMSGGSGDGLGNHAESTSNVSPNANMIQDLNSSVAFPQLVESQQFHPHHHSQLVSQSSLSAQPQPSCHLLQSMPSSISCNMGGNVNSVAGYANSTGSNSNVSNNNNHTLGISTTRATYSQSLLTAVSNAVDEPTKPLPVSNVAGALANSTSETPTTVGAANGGHPTKGSATESGKASLHKSKSVDNNDIYYSNEHYPALEKTVKSYHHGKVHNSVDASGGSASIASTTAPGVGNGKNAPKAVAIVVSGNMASSANSLSFGQVAAANVVTVATASSTSANAPPKKGKAKKDPNGTAVAVANNPVVSVVATQPPVTDGMDCGNTSESWNHGNAVLIDTDSQAGNMLPFDTRSPMNGGSGVNAIHFIQTSPQIQQQQHVATTTGVSQTVAASSGIGAPASSTSKRHKKDKHQQHSSTPASTGSKVAGTVGAGNASNHAQQKNRPAVIIVNDNDPKPNEFTFGFGIDQELFFGDFSEEDRRLLESDGSCPEPPKTKGKQQRVNTATAGTDPIAAQQSVALSNSRNVPLHSSELEYGLMQRHQQQQHQTVALSPNSLNDATRNSMSKTSPSSGSSSVSSSSASLSSATTCNSYHQQPIVPPMVQMAPMTTMDQANEASEASIDAAVAGANLFHQPPPVAPPLLMSTIYNQPPPTLLSQHLVPQGTQPAPPGRIPHMRHHHQQSLHHQQQHHHNQYALPPPVMTPTVPAASAAVTDANGNAVPPVVAVPHRTNVPPPPLPSTLAIVPPYGTVLLPAGAVPGAPALQPVAVTAPLVPSVAPTGALIVAQPTVGSSPVTLPIASSDIVNHNNTSPHNSSLQHQTVAVANNNSIAQSYHQQQQQLPQQPTVHKITVDTAAQTQSTSSQSSPSSVAAEPTKPMQPVAREKMKEINLRFIAPEQVHTTEYNHDKIVFFVGTAWEDAICGSNGTAKYYEDQ
ncbi:mucin-19 [Anopheles nili]|uniref:mucin-19 n=1 Tax=Anopheles nili TaxID=185578 RepID=UPI00237ABED3|nr:mucin-19 [Anopheles nili]